MIYKRGSNYWTDFAVDGVRYRKPLKTKNWQEAKGKERDEIELARSGRLDAKQDGPKKLFPAIEAYLTHKKIRCSPRTLELEEERLSIVKQHVGDVTLRAITARTIANYQQTRHNAGIANRTINMDVGALRRVLKHSGRWHLLEHRVDNLPENQKAIGRALALEEQERLSRPRQATPIGNMSTVRP